VTVLVTGGSGVVGREVVRLLVDQGRRVRALARSETSGDVVGRLGATPVHGDVLDYGSLIDAVEDAEVVYHVAGVNTMCARSIDSMRRANVDGTRNVIRAAAAAGARRVVYTSSAVTLGEAKGTVGDETTPHRGWFLSSYERTKFEAEQVALGERVGVEVVAVNPSSVQGPGRVTGTGRLLLAIASGKLPLLIDTTFSVVDIADTARGHLLAETKGVPGERYVLSGFSVSTREAVEMLREVSGRDVRVARIPPGVLTFAGWIAQTFTSHPQFCAEMARVLAFGHAYDGARATRELGLTYTDPRDTLARTVAWFRDTGRL
jgi:dihydroflavonol-4-reductase